MRRTVATVLVGLALAPTACGEAEPTLTVLAASSLTEAFGEQTASAWLFGTNSYLGDEAPAYVLRHGDQPAQITPVVVAARSFIESAGPDGAVMEEAALPSAPTDALRRRVRSLEASQMKLDQQLQDLTRELRRATSERAAG